MSSFHQTPCKLSAGRKISRALATYLIFIASPQEFPSNGSSIIAQDRWSYHTARKLRAADSIFISINIPANKLKRPRRASRRARHIILTDSQAAINWHQIMSRARGAGENSFDMRSGKISFRTEIWDAPARRCHMPLSEHLTLTCALPFVLIYWGVKLAAAYKMIRGSREHYSPPSYIYIIKKVYSEKKCVE